MDDYMVIESSFWFIIDGMADNMMGHFQHNVFDIVLEEYCVCWRFDGEWSKVEVQVFDIIEIVVVGEVRGQIDYESHIVLDDMLIVPDGAVVGQN